MSHVRKTVYLCRAPLCKRANAVLEWVHGDGRVETAPAWQGQCGACGRGSFDIQYQKDLCPPSQFNPFSTLGEIGTSPVLTG